MKYSCKAFQLLILLLFSCKYVYSQTGIGTLNPKQKLHVENGSVLATMLKTSPSNHPNFEPAYVDSIDFIYGWYPAKCSFRSFGAPTYNLASLTNPNFMGAFSFASGFETIAFGKLSTAIGINASSSGVLSSAFGIKSNAQGYLSIATGYNTLSTGINSVAQGYEAHATGDHSVAIGTKVSTNLKTGSFIFGDNKPFNGTSLKNDAPNQIKMRFSNGYSFYTGNNMGVRLLPGGNAWVIISDKNRKENFLTVTPEHILNKLSKIQLTSWNYKGQDPKQFRHYGIMAQDFYHAFGTDELGKIGNSTKLNQADVDGLCLLAIKALVMRTSELEAKSRTLLLQLESLKDEMALLTAMQ